MYSCIHGQAPRYLIDFCHPTSSVAYHGNNFGNNIQVLKIPSNYTEHHIRFINFVLDMFSEWHHRPTELGPSGPTYYSIFCSSVSVRICNVESYFTLNQTAIMCHSQFDSIGTQNVQPSPVRQLRLRQLYWKRHYSEGVYCLAVVWHGSWLSTVVIIITPNSPVNHRITNHAKIIGGGRPLVPKILHQSDRVGAKSPIFDLFSLVAPQP